MNKIICIYHGNCTDGFAAAWAVWKRFPDAEFYPGIYGNPPPKVKGKHVIFADFLYKPEVLKIMSEEAESILILDHHKTARDALISQSCPRTPVIITDWKTFSWDKHLQNVSQDKLKDSSTAVIYAFFDMDRSGSRIAWEFFHPNQPTPRLILHVEDIDLWRFNLDNTREINACLSSYDDTFANLDYLVRECQTEDGRKKLVDEGKTLQRKHIKDMTRILALTKRPMWIGGYYIWVANLPDHMASDGCNIMAQIPPPNKDIKTPKFAASYYDKPNGRAFSLRSIGEFDVSEIAKKYGGGGHKNSAGFIMPIGWEGDIKK